MFSDGAFRRVSGSSFHLVDQLCQTAACRLILMRMELQAADGPEAGEYEG